MWSEAEPLLGSLAHDIGSEMFRERELEEHLEEVVVIAKRVFDGAGAGLMLLGAGDEPQLVAATSEPWLALERAQQDAGAGPGISATRDRQVVAVSDLAQDPRWPQIRAAVNPLGVVSVLSAPIWLSDRPAGNLNLFDTVAGRWSERDRQSIATFAGVVEALVRTEIGAYRNGRRIVELRRRLARDVGGNPESRPS